MSEARRFDALVVEAGLAGSRDAAAAIARWRRSGLIVAVAEEASAEAVPRSAERHGIDSGDAVAVVASPNAARAAQQAGFRLIAGVDAAPGAGARLLQAGAHEVAPNLFRVRFPRRIVALLDVLDDLAAWQRHRPPALFLDYDGTLSPIVDDPAAAVLPPDTRIELERLAARFPLAVISGRDRIDVAARVGLDNVLYAGNHGFDVAGRGQRKTLPEAEQALGRVAAARAELERRLGDVDGVIIEAKRFSTAVHYRRVVALEQRRRVRDTVAAVHAGSGLRLRSGKEVFELEPDVPWNKGYALDWLLEVMQVDPAEWFPIYVGDDVTDEDAFAALGGRGAGILVGPSVSTSLADYRLESPDQVRTLLRWFRGGTTQGAAR